MNTAYWCALVTGQYILTYSFLRIVDLGVIGPDELSFVGVDSAAAILCDGSEGQGNGQLCNENGVPDNIRKLSRRGPAI